MPKLPTLISVSLQLQIMNRLRPRVRSDEYYEDMSRKQILGGTTQKLTSNKARA